MERTAARGLYYSENSHIKTEAAEAKKMSKKNLDN